VINVEVGVVNDFLSGLGEQHRDVGALSNTANRGF